MLLGVQIYGNEPPQRLWKQDPAAVVTKMKSSIAMFDAYTTQFQEVKRRAGIRTRARNAHTYARIAVAADQG